MPIMMFHRTERLPLPVAPPPPPPPPAGGIVPDAPLWGTLTASGSGQLTAAWDAVLQLIDGSAIAGDPILGYRVRWALSEENAQEGGTPAAAPITTTSLSAVITGLTAGLIWYVSISAYNSSGESSYSFTQSLLVN